MNFTKAMRVDQILSRYRDTNSGSAAGRPKPYVRTQWRAGATGSGSLFIIWDLMNSTESVEAAYQTCRGAPTASLPVAHGALWSLTLNTRLGSCINAVAYWSSVIQARMMKQRVMFYMSNL